MKRSGIILLLFSFLPCFFCVSAFSDTGFDKSSYTGKEMELRISMRKFFSDNLTWERIYILEALSGSLDVDKAKDRVNKNQENLGAALKPYLGDETGSQLADILKQYVQLLTDYINSVKSGSDKSFVTGKIHDNIDSEADLLSRANLSWPKADLAVLLKKYSDLLMSEIDMQNTKMGSIDQVVFDATSDQAMAIADTFSSGIMQGYPGKFW